MCAWDWQEETLNQWSIIDLHKSSVLLFMFHKSQLMMYLFSFPYKNSQILKYKKKKKKKKHIINCNWWNIKWHTKNGKADLYSFVIVCVRSSHSMCLRYKHSSRMKTLLMILKSHFLKNLSLFFSLFLHYFQRIPPSWSRIFLWTFW